MMVPMKYCVGYCMRITFHRLGSIVFFPKNFCFKFILLRWRVAKVRSARAQEFRLMCVPSMGTLCTVTSLLRNSFQLEISVHISHVYFGHLSYCDRCTLSMAKLDIPRCFDSI